MTDPRTEALRRRLYRPGVSDGDRAAYAAATSGPREPAPADRGRAGRPRRAPPLAALGAAVAAGTVAAALLGPRAPTSEPAPRPVPVSAGERAALVRALDRGTDADVAGALPARSGPATLDVVEGHGAGPGILRLEPDLVGGGAGRATVLVVLARPATASWSADRLILDRRHAVRPSAVLRRGGPQDAGLPTEAEVAYAAGERPVRLRIDVPAGVRWGAAVVFGRGG